MGVWLCVFVCGCARRWVAVVRFSYSSVLCVRVFIVACVGGCGCFFPIGYQCLSYGICMHLKVQASPHSSTRPCP